MEAAVDVSVDVIVAVGLDDDAMDALEERRGFIKNWCAWFFSGKFGQSKFFISNATSVVPRLCGNNLNHILARKTLTSIANRDKK